MADENMIFIQEVAPSANAYGREGMYFASSTHVGTGFQHAFSTVPSGYPDVGLRVAGVGMAPATFALPEGALAGAGYGAAEGVPVEDVPAAALQPLPAWIDGEVVPFKVAWTQEEDNMLKELVRACGEGKWAEIAVYLPGRTGKQCRERWTNQLHPGLKNDVWTEHDDRVLIEAHKIFRNRWATIARYLPGRSENAVKNHWNATKRSLTSNRRLKKKKSEQAAPGQFTLLEEYIRSQSPATVIEPPTAPAPAPQLTLIREHYGGPGINPYGAPQPAPDSNLQGMEMNVDNSTTISSMSLNTLALPDLNAYGAAAKTKEPCYPIVPFECSPSYNLMYGGGLPQMMINGEDTQQLAADTDLSMLFPFAEDVVPGQLEWESYEDVVYGQAAGPSSAGGSSDPDNFEVVQMASSFLNPSEDEVTLDLTRFK